MEGGKAFDRVEEASMYVVICWDCEEILIDARR